MFYFSKFSFCFKYALLFFILLVMSRSIVLGMQDLLHNNIEDSEINNYIEKHISRIVDNKVQQKYDEFRSILDHEISPLKQQIMQMKKEFKLVTKQCSKANEYITENKKLKQEGNAAKQQTFMDTPITIYSTVGEKRDDKNIKRMQYNSPSSVTKVCNICHLNAEFS